MCSTLCSAAAAVGAFRRCQPETGPALAPRVRGKRTRPSARDLRAEFRRRNIRPGESARHPLSGCWRRFGPACRGSDDAPVPACEPGKIDLRRDMIIGGTIALGYRRVTPRLLIALKTSGRLVILVMRAITTRIKFKEIAHIDRRRRYHRAEIETPPSRATACRRSFASLSARAFATCCAIRCSISSVLEPRRQPSAAVRA